MTSPHDSTSPGRPAGEVRQAVRQAARELTTPDRAPTVRDLATYLRTDPARLWRTVDRMRCAGELVPVRCRRVGYRARPVAEYAPVAALRSQGFGAFGLAAAVQLWQAQV